MPLFRNILFPVDFSTRCERIAPAVQAIAHHFQARLTLLHAYEVAPAYYPEGGAYVPPITAESMRDYASKNMATFVEKHFAAAAPRTSIVRGEPAHAVLDFVRAEGVDLIMIPTRGFGRFRRLLLGSVAAKVLHDAPCAVWTDSHAEDVDHNIGFPYRNILCAVGNDDNALPTVVRAGEIGEEFQAEVRVIHSVQAPEVVGAGFDEASFRSFLIQTAKEGLAKLQEKAGTHFHMCVEGGTPEEVVARIANRVNAELVVIHRSGPGLIGRLRSHDYAIIRESPCPVLSI